MTYRPSAILITCFTKYKMKEGYLDQGIRTGLCFACLHHDKAVKLDKEDASEEGKAGVGGDGDEGAGGERDEANQHGPEDGACLNGVFPIYKSWNGHGKSESTKLCRLTYGRRFNF